MKRGMIHGQAAVSCDICFSYEKHIIAYLREISGTNPTPKGEHSDSSDEESSRDKVPLQLGIYLTMNRKKPLRKER